MPLVLYHGTFAQFEKFEITHDLGFHFGNWEAANQRRRYSSLKPDRTQNEPRWRVIGACLRIKRPIIFNNDPGAWSFDHVLNMLASNLTAAQHAELSKRVNEGWTKWTETIHEQQKLVDQELSKRPLTTEAIANEVERGLIANIFYNADYARQKLEARRHRYAEQKIQSKYPDLIYPFKPGSVIKGFLIEEGFDGVGYLNNFEKKNSISWAAFRDKDILQVCENRIYGPLEASHRTQKNAGYRGRPNPITPPEANSRTSNWYSISPKAEIMFFSSLKKTLKKIPGLEFQQQIEDGYKFKRTLHIKYAKTETCISIGDGGLFNIRSFIRFEQKAGHKVKPNIPLNMEWPIGATPARAAELTLAKVLDSVLQSIPSDSRNAQPDPGYTPSIGM